MLLLIAGIPGSGKTSVGDYLRDEHRYLHVDMEALIQSMPPGTRWEEVLARLETDGSGRNDVVVTWGFIPNQDDEVVRALQRSEFRLVWLDGNREAARRAFMARGTVSVDLLEIQMARIERLDLASFSPRIINPFDEQGQFRTRASIASDILV